MVNFRQILEQRKGQLQQVHSSLKQLRKDLEEKKQEQLDCEQAQIVIMEVARITQQELKYQISELVTLALASVFDNPYALEVDFVQRRNQTEADLWFVRDGERMKPISATGGGAVDVAAFALRVSLWSLQPVRSRAIMLADEPFKHLKGEKANIRAFQMVKSVSEKLKLQIIMVSDERLPIEEIEAGADKILRIGIRKGISYVV